MQENFYSTSGKKATLSEKPVQRIKRYRDTDDSEDLEETEEFGIEQPNFSSLKIGLSLREYTKLAATNALEYDEAEAWRSINRSHTWDFVRLMKAHPALMNLSGDEATEVIPWEETDFDDADMVQVAVEWDRVKYLPSQGPLDAATSLSRQKPLIPKRCQGGKYQLYSQFISLAGWLQILQGEGVQIYLPVRKVAKHLDCDKETISTLRNLAVRDGFLKVVAHHTVERATRFTFAVDRFPALREWRQ